MRPIIQKNKNPTTMPSHTYISTAGETDFRAKQPTEKPPMNKPTLEMTSAAAMIPSTMTLPRPPFFN